MRRVGGEHWCACLGIPHLLSPARALSSAAASTLTSAVRAAVEFLPDSLLHDFPHHSVYSPSFGATFKGAFPGPQCKFYFHEIPI